MGRSVDIPYLVDPSLASTWIAVWKIEFDGCGVTSGCEYLGVATCEAFQRMGFIMGYGVWWIVSTDKNRARESVEFFMCTVCPVGAETLRTSISYFLAKRIYFEEKTLWFDNDVIL